MTPLILGTDDFGYHAGVDAAVLELATKGRLTATSCMTLSPLWRAAARNLTPDIRSRIDVGVHLDFTEFGAHRSWNRLALCSYARQLDRTWVRTQIAKQLDAFEEALGTPPDYIDGHQHVHQLPQIRAELVGELQRRYPTVKPWIRISLPVAGGFKGCVIGMLGANALARTAGQAGFMSSQRLLGVYAFNLQAPAFKERIEDWLKASRPRDALMLHPAQAAPAEDPIGRARLVEFEVLGSEWFGEALRRYDIEPARGSQALRH